MDIENHIITAIIAIEGTNCYILKPTTLGTCKGYSSVADIPFMQKININYKYLCQGYIWGEVGCRPTCNKFLCPFPLFKPYKIPSDSLCTMYVYMHKFPLISQEQMVTHTRPVETLPLCLITILVGSLLSAA